MALTLASLIIMAVLQPSGDSLRSQTDHASPDDVPMVLSEHLLPLTSEPESAPLEAQFLRTAIDQAIATTPNTEVYATADDTGRTLFIGSHTGPGFLINLDEQSVSEVGQAFPLGYLGRGLWLIATIDSGIRTRAIYEAETDSLRNLPNGSIHAAALMDGSLVTVSASEVLHIKGEVSLSVPLPDFRPSSEARVYSRGSASRVILRGNWRQSDGKWLTESRLVDVIAKQTHSLAGRYAPDITANVKPAPAAAALVLIASPVRSTSSPTWATYSLPDSAPMDSEWVRGQRLKGRLHSQSASTDWIVVSRRTGLFGLEGVESVLTQRSSTRNAKSLGDGGPCIVMMLRE